MVILKISGFLKKIILLSFYEGKPRELKLSHIPENFDRQIERVLQFKPGQEDFVRDFWNSR